nr:zinc finger protein 665-like [Lytechinus pictus]
MSSCNRYSNTVQATVSEGSTKCEIGTVNIVTLTTDPLSSGPPLLDPSSSDPSTSNPLTLDPSNINPSTLDPSKPLHLHHDATFGSHIAEDTAPSNHEEKSNTEGVNESSAPSNEPTEVLDPEALKESSSVTMASSVVPVGILLARQVEVVSEDLVREDKDGLTIVDDFSRIPFEEAHIEGVIRQDSNLSQIPSTVHLQPDTCTLLGEVAMEIHIPMNSQLAVGDYAEENHQSEEDKQLYIIEDEVELLDMENRQPSLEPDAPEGDVKKLDINAHSHVKSSIPRVAQEYCCEKCGKTFSKSFNFYRHLKVHSGKKFKCDFCNKVYGYRETLKAHINSCHTEHAFIGVHKCKYCPRYYPSAVRLGVHLRTHKFDKPFSCNECHKTFSSSGGLKRHQIVHSSIKDFYCDTCGLQFSRKRALENHKIIHSSDRTYKCSLCSWVFPDGYSRRTHKCIHYTDRPHGCQFCPKRFKSPSALRTHMKIHTRAKIHSCTKCSFTSGTQSELKMHKRSHWKDSIGDMQTLEKNQCKECGAKFTHASSLRVHERSHSGEMQYICPTCDKPFMYHASWKRHQQIHKGEKAHQCKKCGKGFTKGAYLKRHKNGLCQGHFLNVMKKKKKEREKKSESPQNVALKNVNAPMQPKLSVGRSDDIKIEKNNVADKQGHKQFAIDPISVNFELKPFTCEICGKMFKVKQSLQRHLNSHQGKKPFPCDRCGKSYSRRPILKEHLLLVHGVGPTIPLFPCPDCSLSFPSLKRLEKHRRKHTGERPYNCKYCSKAFKETSSLNRHEIIHTGAKPHKCSICNRGFSDRGNLTKHELTHGIRGMDSMENIATWKPFSCQDCGKTFDQLGYLRYHMQMHEQKLSFQCKLCDRRFSKIANLKVHLKSHINKEHQCDACFKSFRKESTLQAHQVNCNNTKKYFVCCKCNRVLCSKDSLQRHERMHLGLKPFKCPACHLSYGDKSTLKRHMVTHKGDGTVLFCKKCDAIFASQESLDEHVGEKSCLELSHVCDKCGKTFTSRRSLAQHFRTHNPKSKTEITPKEKIYVCDLCHSQFPKKKYLSTHKRENKCKI